MKRSEYLEKRREILNECTRKLNILDQAFELWGGKPVLEKSEQGSGTASNGWQHPISKRDVVRESVKAITAASFTLKNAKSAIQGKYPDMAEGISDNQLSANLSKLAEMGELIIVKKKLGTSPAIYSLPVTKPPHGENE